MTWTLHRPVEPLEWGSRTVFVRSPNGLVQMPKSDPRVLARCGRWVDPANAPTLLQRSRSTLWDGIRVCKVCQAAPRR